MRTTLERFWNKVDVSGPEDCWEWTAALNPRGYGQFKEIANQPPVKAHRFSYKLHFGDIPDGLYVCHSCDNPKCVNPNHLWIGTALDNTRDMMSKGRESKVGSRFGRRKLTESDVSGILRLLDLGVTHRHIGKLYGVWGSTISNIKTNKSWK